MEERQNCGAGEGCLRACPDVIACSGPRLQSDNCAATPLGGSSVGPRSSILQSLLSRPVDGEAMAVRNGSQCRIAVPEGVGHRPRSRSMGTAWWTIPEVASSTSQDSLDYSDDLREPRSEALRTDRLIEVARCKLMTLRTSEEEDRGPDVRSRLSYSQPGSPPREKPGQHRKYSEGSRLKACLQGLRTGFRTPDSSMEPHPVDFSCRRRKKFEGIAGLPYARPACGYPASSSSTDEGLGDDCSSEQSILKSILTGRGRSNTISTCGSRSRYDALGNFADQSQRIARQPVALAKKNLHPVTAKVNDCISQVVAFVRSVPEIAALSGADQRTVIAASLHRLLLLFMAESNIHFVVAPVLHSVDMDRITESRDDQRLTLVDQAAPPMTAVGSVSETEFPTFQFAESVKSFVTKCQSLSISADEYRLMKLIALFQSAGGLGSVEVSTMADGACSVARHQLQQLIERSCSGSSCERAHQRYSSLLLTIYTLSGVHCGMLDALFCRPTISKQ